MSPFADSLLSWVSSASETIRRTLRNLETNVGGHSNLQPEVEVLRYEDAISYFVDARPAGVQSVRGAMMVEARGEAQLFTQLFLADDNTAITDSAGHTYGRRLLARQLDPELLETFAGKTLVIVE